MAEAEVKEKCVRGHNKVREGAVLSAKMDKTVVVGVTTMIKHPEFGKYVRRTKKYYAHDQQNQCGFGDIVRIVESRPLSKTKRWRVQGVLTKNEIED